MQTVAEEGLVPSIGSISDAFDNAAAETVTWFWNGCIGITLTGCTRHWSIGVQWNSNYSILMKSTARYPKLPLVS